MCACENLLSSRKMRATRIRDREETKILREKHKNHAVETGLKERLENARSDKVMFEQR